MAVSMSNKGWVSIYREIQSHWVWEDRPFSKGQAWLDLVMLANHKENKFVLGNELINVERGQFVTSELKLMERWGWGKSKTRAFLQLLQDDEMIVKKSDRKKTTITIVKYSAYQDFQTTEIPEVDRKQTDNRLITDTNNNENNEKKIYSDDFETFYKVYPNPKGKAQTYKNWKKVIKQHDPNEIIECAKRYQKSLRPDTEKAYITTSYNFLGQKQAYLDYLQGSERDQRQREHITRDIFRFEE